MSEDLVMKISEVIKIAVDAAFTQLLEDEDGSSYREQAMNACISAATQLHRIKAGLQVYKDPDFLYCDEDIEDSDDILPLDLDAVILGEVDDID